MSIRAIALTILALALAATASAQERPRRGAPVGPPPFAERVHEIRLERLRDALELDDETAAALREELERNREAHRDALEARREAMRGLREKLGRGPAPEDEIDRALEALERHHERMGRLEREHHARLAEILTPSQRAKLLVFSRRFDERLRQMLHRGPGFREPGRDGPRPPRRGIAPPPGAPGRDLRGPDADDPEARAEALRRRIERMESALEGMREELRAIETESGE